jgi:hypothetical protein
VGLRGSEFGVVAVDCVCKVEGAAAEHVGIDGVSDFGGEAEEGRELLVAG